MASMRKKCLSRWVNADGKRCKPHAPGAKLIREVSSKYYGFGVPGSKKPIPLATDKRVSEQLLARLISEGELAAAGLTTAAERSKSIGVLIGEYREHLLARGTTEKQASEVKAKLARLAADLHWQTPRQLSADAVSDWLHSITGPDGISPQTRNHYLVTVRAFVRWLGRSPRRLIAGDLLDLISRLPVHVEQRRARRALTPDELTRLLAATLESGVVLRCLTPRQRHLLYAVAASTGFRAQELASLTVESLSLDTSPPCILLASRRGKNRKPTRQPLHPDVASLLRTYAKEWPAEQPLWPGRWADGHTAEMLRCDLARAGIPYSVDGPDGLLYADFHSLRHTFVAHLDLAGVSLRDAMQLARHSDPRLTMARYGRSQVEALGRAVEGLPGCLTGCPSGCLPDGEDLATSEKKRRSAKKKRAA